MTDAEMVVALLTGLRAQCEGVIQTVDLILSTGQKPASDDEQACVHPIAARVSVAAMGHPTRFKCRICTQTVEG